MKVNLKRFKIEKAADKDDPRFAGVYLDAVQSVLVATNGYGFAVVPVNELELEDSDGLIPAEAVTMARKSQKKGYDAELSANGKVGVTLHGKRVEFDREEHEIFPDWKKILNGSGRPLVTLELSPKTLQNVAEAIGSGGIVKLEIFEAGKPIRVLPVFSGEEDGLPQSRGCVATQKVRSAAA